MGQAVLIVAAVLAVAVGLAARRRLGFLTFVESESMLPTLVPGQLVVARRPRESRPVRRGDIVVIHSAELGRVIVKRVVGLPGERVDVASGVVRVNGEPLPEPYADGRGGRSGGFDVPSGGLLLLGDNRARSSDSRSWRQPYLAVSAVRGTVVLSRPRRPVAAPPDREPRSGAVARAG